MQKGTESSHAESSLTDGVVTTGIWSSFDSYQKGRLSANAPARTLQNLEKRGG